MPALVWFFLVLAVACADPARADVVVITYGAAGTTEANFTALCTGATNCDHGVENFSTWSGGNFTSTFTDGGSSTTGGVSFSGVYTATGVTTTSQWIPTTSNQYGGDIDGKYPELFGPGSVKGPTGQTQSSYTLALSAANLPSGATGPNYFGVWISALDQYNDMKVYNTNGVLIAQFDSAVLLAALGSCTGGHAANPYCGNPLDGSQDAGELFAFVNIYDMNGTIGSVQFFNSGNTGFESSNDTVAYVDPITVNGTVLDIPEPSSLAVFAVGLLGLVGLRRRLRPRYFADCNASNI